MVFRFKDFIEKDLIPSESPIFVSDLFQEYEKPHPKSVNGKTYADMVREKAHQAVLKLYPNGDPFFLMMASALLGIEFTSFLHRSLSESISFKAIMISFLSCCKV